MFFGLPVSGFLVSGVLQAFRAKGLGFLGLWVPGFGVFRGFLQAFMVSKGS